MIDYKHLCQEFVEEMEMGWSYTTYSPNMLEIYSRALKALNRKPKSKSKHQRRTVAAYINYSQYARDLLKGS